VGGFCKNAIARATEQQAAFAAPSRPKLTTTTNTTQTYTNKQVFTFENWESHRSSDRYLRHIASMFTSRVVWGLKLPLLYVGAIAGSVCAYEAGIEVRCGGGACGALGPRARTRGGGVVF
jgi:hypothetical protein